MAEENATAEPAPEIDSSKKGKELSYEEEKLSKILSESSESGSIESSTMQMSSTTRKQKYTYDFEQEEKPSSERTLIKAEQSQMKPIGPVVEGSTMRSSSEQPAPVTEDLSDDTPMPTENYFKPKSIEQRTEVNVMDGTVTPSSVPPASPTIYSTTAPIKLEYEDNARPSIRVVPVSVSSENPMYSVTENILEQSPFLPENENGDSVLNILHTPHDDEESKAKSLNIDEDDSLENDDANAISGPEIIPRKAYKIGETTSVDSKESLKGFGSSDETTKEIPSDSTEIYNLQESRTHNHDNTEASKSIEKQSDETMEFSHMKGGAVPTTIIPFENSDDDDSTEMEPMTDIMNMAMMNQKQLTQEKPVEISSSSSISPASSTSQESSDLHVEQTTFQSRNAMKNIDAIDESSTEQLASVSSTSEKIATSSEKIDEISPSAEPSAEPSASLKEETITQSVNGSSETSTVRVEQTVSVVSVINHTETKNEIVTATNGKIDEISPTAEPSLQSSNTNEKVPLKENEPSSTTSANSIEVKPSQSIELSASESSVSAKSIESGTVPLAEPTPSETTASTTEGQKLSEMELKVIPLQTTRKPDRPDDISAEAENQTEKVNSTEITESTTGHFLSQATFQPAIKQSVGTSLKSSDNEGNDTTGNDNGMMNAFNENSTNVMDSSALSTPTPTLKFGYTRCTAGQFECLNGTSIIDGDACISLSQRCDSIQHCSDASDEADCEMLGCPDQFQCSDGTCLARSLVCDKILHCADGSDEADTLCGDWKCKFDEMACSENGPCLPAILKCDGIEHCSNQADETNCPDTCKNNEFYCSSQRKCIPETFVCDGKIDCNGKFQRGILNKKDNSFVE